MLIHKELTRPDVLPIGEGSDSQKVSPVAALLHKSNRDLPNERSSGGLIQRFQPIRPMFGESESRKDEMGR